MGKLEKASTQPVEKHRLNNGRDLCLHPECQRTPTTRGLCGSHYVYATRAVKHQGFTWDDLVKAGKILPTTRVSKKSNQDWFTQGVTKAKDVQETE